ncbi:hypothetical protein, partial [Yanghanlia caeni]|nr:hypothetical protein [Alcaligenaceae bacterium LG-2]
MPNNHAKKNQSLTVPQHFYRPKTSRNWYVRLVPPAHLKGVPGVEDLRKSTGHADLKRARPIGQTLIAERLREWDALVVPEIFISAVICAFHAAKSHSFRTPRLSFKRSPGRLAAKAGQNRRGIVPFARHKKIALRKG